MPFICLANANVTNGVLQVSDLWPNVSQKGIYDPPGQNRYLRRPRGDTPSVHLTTGVVTGIPAEQNLQNFEGLGAYLVDKVEPGALEQADATVVFAAQPNVGDRIVVKGIIFQFQAGANPANWNAPAAGTAANPFLVGVGASANDAAANFTLAVNDAADVQAAILAAAPVNTTLVATNPGAPSANVVLSAEDNLAAPLLGRTGDISVVVTVGGARITEPTLQRASRTFEAWNQATLAAAMTAIQTRVDTGLGLTLANVNTALNGVSADLTGAAATSSSVGTLLELLSVLAGRTYRIPAGSLKFTAATAPDQVHVWSTTLRGGFTEPNTTWDTDMLGGEWGATTAGSKYLKTGGNYNKPVFNGGAGGDVVNNEIGAARATYHSSAFEASLLTGQLSRLSDGTVTLFPDPDVQAYVANRSALSPVALRRQQPLTAQRLVTVYDDDGTLLV